jgi:hypothetical protein
MCITTRDKSTEYQSAVSFKFRGSHNWTGLMIRHVQRFGNIRLSFSTHDHLLLHDLFLLSRLTKSCRDINVSFSGHLANISSRDLLILVSLRIVLNDCVQNGFCLIRNGPIGTKWETQWSQNKFEFRNMKWLNSHARMAGSRITAAAAF